MYVDSPKDSIQIHQGLESEYIGRSYSMSGVILKSGKKEENTISSTSRLLLPAKNDSLAKNDSGGMDKSKYLSNPSTAQPKVREWIQ
jgi:hypothetical protein